MSFSGVLTIIGNVLKVDVVVVGSGLAGLSTTYFLGKYLSGRQRLRAAIISKSSLGYGTSTYYSAGAFRCPVGGYSEEDYVREVLDGGRYINNELLVRLLAERSVEAVTSLEALGVRFNISRGMLRVVSNDRLFPGKELVLALRNYVLSRDWIKILDNTHVLDVILGSDGSFYTLCLSSSNYTLINSKVVVLGTGGASNIFIRSDNPQQLTCDGHRISLRIGLPLIDMEFVQFFPLGIAEEGKPSFMIPFTNGKLVNRLGEDLISKYQLESLGKAIIYYRDRLSRSMMLEVRVGNDVKGALALYPETVEGELTSFAYELMKKLRLGKPVKVLPTAHFSMGGVEVSADLNTLIDGLYVVGELVGGIHGANRLGGNALTGCVVTSMKVAENVVKYLGEKFNDRLTDGVDVREVKHIVERYSLREGVYVAERLKDDIRKLMWANVGVLRSDESIRKCIDWLNDVYENLSRVRIGNYSDIVRYSELENILLTSLAVSHSALLRTESRGSHFRTDYPEEDVKWRKNIRITYHDGKLRYSI